jgi:heptosyltransferase-3
MPITPSRPSPRVNDTSVRRPASEAFDSILVIITRSIGDVLLTTPLIHEARALWPDAHIDVLGFKGTLDILRGNPDVRELIEVRHNSGLRQSWPLIRRLWRRYHLALIAEHSDRAFLYGWMAAPVRAGLVPDTRAAWWKRMLSRHIGNWPDRPSHTVLVKLHLLSPWGRPSDKISVRPPPKKELPADIAARLRPGYVVMHAPTLVRYKQWPLQHYAQVASVLARLGRQILLTGSDSAADRSAVAEVKSLADSDLVLDMAGHLDLQQMVTLLSGAAAYIGPDTSITHLSAACGTPTVALYGPVDPRRWGPWPAVWPPVQPYEAHADRQVRHNVVLLQGAQTCVPCSRAGCDNSMNSRSDCLDTLAPERVLHEVRALLGQNKTEGNDADQ